jgi:hypothetical protein
MGERRSPQARPLPAAEISQGEVITLANGHHLGFAQYGDSDGKLLLFFHGTPGSRVLGRGLGAAARRYGIRLIVELLTPQPVMVEHLIGPKSRRRDGRGRA